VKKKVAMILLCVLVLSSLIGCREKQHEEVNQAKQKQEKETVAAVEAETDTPHVEETRQTDHPENAEKKPTESGQSQKVETMPNTNTTPQETPTTEIPKTVETPKAEETPIVPAEPKATASDSKAVADKVLEYINSYRSTPATKLPGLTRYAEYRSRQLIRNFAHDTSDERAAATSLQYGTYIDPPLYGMTGEPYYESGAREAIAKAGYVGSIDYVAERLASLVRNSAGHWAYVGSGEYPYMAVGVTYESGMWYCDIAMARENTDNN